MFIFVAWESICTCSFLLNTNNQWEICLRLDNLLTCIASGRLFYFNNFRWTSVDRLSYIVFILFCILKILEESKSLLTDSFFSLEKCSGNFHENFRYYRFIHNYRKGWIMLTPTVCMNRLISWETFSIGYLHRLFSTKSINASNLTSERNLPKINDVKWQKYGQ